MMAGVLLASQPLFQGQYEITGVDGNTNTGFRLVGKFEDASLLGWGASDATTNDLIFCYSSFGDLDLWKVTNIVSVSGANLTVDVEYNETGVPRAGAPQAGYQIMCRPGYDGYASFIPSLTFGSFTEYLQNGARNLNLKYAIMYASSNQGVSITWNEGSTNYASVYNKTNVHISFKTNYSTGAGIITNMLGSDGSMVWTDSGGPQPDGSVTAYVAGVVADYATTGTVGAIDVRVTGVETGKVDLTAATYTDTVAKASAAYPASNPSNFITEVGAVSHTNLTDANGAADIQHLTAAEKAHAAAAITNETSATNISAGASDSYNYSTRTLTWNTNAAGGGGVGTTTPAEST